MGQKSFIRLSGSLLGLVLFLPVIIQLEEISK